MDGQVEAVGGGVLGERLPRVAERLERRVGGEERRAVVGEGEGDEPLAGQPALDPGEGERGLDPSPSRTQQAPIS